jgi:hypothetical protein
MKQAKLLWLQDPGEITWDNLNNIRRDVSMHFTNKKMNYLKDKNNELATNSKNRNIRGVYRGINELKRDYQPSSKSVKNEVLCFEIPTIF